MDNWAPGYREYPPPPALADAVACLWTSAVPPGADPAGRPAQVELVLPDACVDLIWERGRGVYVAGPDTGPAPAPLAAGTVIAGVRFRPGAGGPALGLPLSAVRDQRVDAADLGTGPGAALARLPGSLPPAMARRLLTQVAGTLTTAGPADPLAAAAARLLGRPGTQVERVAARLGVSERQLLRRCLAAVGYGPATLRRVLRFRRFLSAVDAGGVVGAAGLAGLAARAGYADQAHLTRECARLAGLTPAALAAVRASGSARAGVTGPAPA